MVMYLYKMMRLASVTILILVCMDQTRGCANGVFFKPHCCIPAFVKESERARCV